MEPSVKAFADALAADREELQRLVAENPTVIAQAIAQGQGSGDDALLKMATELLRSFESQAAQDDAPPSVGEATIEAQVGVLEAAMGTLQEAAASDQS